MRGRDREAAALLVLFLRQFKQRAAEEGESEEVEHISSVISEIERAASEESPPEQPS